MDAVLYRSCILTSFFPLSSLPRPNGSAVARNGSVPALGLGVNLAARAQPDPHGEHHGDHDLHNTPRADAASIPRWATATNVKGGFLSSRTNVNGGWW